MSPSSFQRKFCAARDEAAYKAEDELYDGDYYYSGSTTNIGFCAGADFAIKFLMQSEEWAEVRNALRLSRESADWHYGKDRCEICKELYCKQEKALATIRAMEGGE